MTNIGFHCLLKVYESGLGAGWSMSICQQCCGQAVTTN